LNSVMRGFKSFWEERDGGVEQGKVKNEGGNWEPPERDGGSTKRKKGRREDQEGG